jgi:hypothetical protein
MAVFYTEQVIPLLLERNAVLIIASAESLNGLRRVLAQQRPTPRGGRAPGRPPPYLHLRSQTATGKPGWQSYLTLGPGKVDHLWCENG